MCGFVYELVVVVEGGFVVGVVECVGSYFEFVCCVCLFVLVVYGGVKGGFVDDYVVFVVDVLCQVQWEIEGVVQFEGEFVVEYFVVVCFELVQCVVED